LAYGSHVPLPARQRGRCPIRGFPHGIHDEHARDHPLSASKGVPSDVGADGTRQARQLLHLVFGGELKSLEGVEFSDISGLDIVGIYPNYAEAYKAWQAAAQRTVDNAQMRYFIVHMHRLLDPQLTGPPPHS
jgi:hypothetical protein